jgi:hypothetical protein
VFWAKEGRQSAVNNNPRKKTTIRNFLHAILIIIDLSTNPKLSAIGINKSQAGRGPGKSTEVKEYV